MSSAQDDAKNIGEGFTVYRKIDKSKKDQIKVLDPISIKRNISKNNI